MVLQIHGLTVVRMPMMMMHSFENIDLDLDRP